MSTEKQNRVPPSLAQHFDSPTDAYTGCFGWLCGYSADAAFLNDAAERFTGQTKAQRAHSGRIYISAILDPGNPAISILDAPGVLHSPIKNISKKPFLLLHAKVALMAFRHQDDASQWLLRLIVSTGNWTRQTLEESLDLAWRIDISSKDIQEDKDDIKQRCADICAAKGLLEWIDSMFDTRLIEKEDETDDARNRALEWIKQCAERGKKVTPRFFDNRSKSLLDQIPDLVEKHCAGVSRNYLAMGSGFYESSKNAKYPSVPKILIDTFKEKKLLTISAPELDLFVNPDGCQSIADSINVLNGQGFFVRKAVAPKTVYGETSQRNLHAKFLFSANYRENSNRCSSAWLYLGSGNLTREGFTNRMGPIGNLEAGVVFAPENLAWEFSRGINTDLVVTNLLPIQWDKELEPEDKVQAGGDMPDREEKYIAAPIAWLTWCPGEEGTKGILLPPSDVTHDYDVLLPTAKPCERNPEGFVWPSPRPRQVRIHWEADSGKVQECAVPVLDEFGRIAASKLPKIDIDAAWWQLANFPMPPEDELLEDDSAEDDTIEDCPPEEIDNNKPKPKGDGPCAYPVRQMMELIENIAAKQTRINEADWPVWCNRLEQTLIQMKDSPVIEYFQNHFRLSPISPLLAAPFRPNFAETAETEKGKRYEEALKRVASVWKVNDLEEIGGVR